MQFYKLLGTGSEGFSTWPDWSVYGLLQVWDSEALAESFKNNVFAPLANTGLSVQVCGNSIMLCSPVRRKRLDFASRLCEVVEMIRHVLDSQPLTS